MENLESENENMDLQAVTRDDTEIESSDSEESQELSLPHAELEVHPLVNHEIEQRLHYSFSTYTLSVY